MIESKIYGHDAEGRPILISRPTGASIKQFYAEHSVEQIIDIFTMVYERMERIILPLSSKKFGKKISRSESTGRNMSPICASGPPRGRGHEGDFQLGGEEEG